MFDRISRSWDLVKASASVLRQDPHLLVFPAISLVASLLVALCFLLPLFGIRAFDAFSGLGGSGGTDGLVYTAGFLFYVTQYSVMFYFNVALVGAAMVRMDGGAPTVGDGLRVANERLGSILGYALIAATVGVVLSAIQERAGFIGRLVAGALGLGWTVATFLVVPVLVVRDGGPIGAIQDSASLMQRTWGENVAGQLGMGAFFGLLYGALLLGGAGLFMVAAFAQSVALMVLVGVALAALVLVAMLAHSALAGIYSAALFNYAERGSGSAGFDSGVLQGAFQPK